jgi:hypothetical protein
MPRFPLHKNVRWRQEDKDIPEASHVDYDCGDLASSLAATESTKYSVLSTW